MKKTILIFAAIFAALSSTNAQQNDFSIDVVRPDSIYLVHKLTDKPTAEKPRPATSTTHTLFKSYADLVAFVGEIRKQARAESDKAAQLLENAKKMNDAADAIENATATAVKSESKQPPNKG